MIGHSGVLETDLQAPASARLMARKLTVKAGGSIAPFRFRTRWAVPH